VHTLPLPRATWGRLDIESGWREFAQAAGADPALAAAVTRFAPDVVLGRGLHSPTFQLNLSRF